MKRTMILLIAVICSFVSAFAQDFNGNETEKNNTPSIYYLEVYELNSLTMKSICINFGINTGSLVKTFKLSDEDGTRILPFENVIGALNYLGQQGWEVVTVYNREMKSGQNIYYLMKFDATKHPKTTLVNYIDTEVLAALK